MAAEPIVVIATAPGRGGIGIVRVSGGDIAPEVDGLLGPKARQLAPRVARSRLDVQFLRCAMGSPGFGIYNVENLWPGRWGGRTSGMGSAPQRDMIDYDVLHGPKVRPAPKLAVNPPPSVAPPSPEELAQLLRVGKERSLNDAIMSNREPTGNLANILRGYGLHGSLDVQSDEGPPGMSDTQFGRGGVRPGTVVRGVGDPAEGMAAEARRAAIDQGFRQRAAEDEARRYQQYAWEREGKIPQAVMPRPVPEIPGQAAAVQAVSGEMTGDLFPEDISFE